MLSVIRCYGFLVHFSNDNGYSPNGGKYLSIYILFLNIFLYSKDLFYFLLCVFMCTYFGICTCECLSPPSPESGVGLGI